jgi:hypothetical protein
MDAETRPATPGTRDRRSRVPPGSRRLESASVAIADNPAALFVYVGADAWKWWRYHDRRGVPCLCLPPHEHPSAFDWAPCRHRDALIVQAGLADDFIVSALVEYVGRAEPRTLIVAADSCDWQDNDGFLFDMPMVRLI